MHSAETAGGDHGFGRGRMRGLLRVWTAFEDGKGRSGRGHPTRRCRMAAAVDSWREKVMHKCRESVEVKERFLDRYAEAIGELSQKMAERFQDGHRLWVMGNGGSACDAQHIAVEFIHPIIEKRRALPALDLVSQIPVVTAISNDKDFARVFIDQIELWGEKDDMALAISTSGKSPNLIYALEAARNQGLLTISF